MCVKYKFLLRAVYLVSKIQPHPTKITRVQINTNNLCLRPYRNGRLQPLHSDVRNYMVVRSKVC